MHGPTSTWRPNGTITAEIDQDGNGTNYIELNGGSVNDGAPHHIVVSRSGNSMKLAIDGFSVDERIGFGVANVYGANPFRIGRSVVGTYPDSQFHPKGTFDDVRIFDRALLVCEIGELAGTATCGVDDDGDSVGNDLDNCTQVPNQDQADFDGDDVGDVCDPSNDIAGTQSPPGSVDPSIAFGANEALAARYAPKLVFDQGASTFPVSAQTFYQNLPAITENTSYASIAGSPPPTYYQIRSCGNAQIRIQYWWFYGYQHPCAAVGGQGAHNGDWESVMVTLSDDRTRVAAVTYWAHGDHFTRLAGGFSSDGLHPLVYVGKTAHGSYHETGGNDFEACTYWGDRRSPGAAPMTMGSWNNLVSLDGNEEPWLAADRIGGFDWGDDGIDTHPTQEAPNCSMNAADWSDTFQGFTVPPSETARAGNQCRKGDSDWMDLMCAQTCAPWQDTEGAWCTDFDCSTPWSCIETADNIWNRIYGHDYDIPTSDLGLLADHYMDREDSWWPPARYTKRRPLAVLPPSATGGGVFGPNTLPGVSRYFGAGSSWLADPFPGLNTVPHSLVAFDASPVMLLGVGPSDQIMRLTATDFQLGYGPVLPGSLVVPKSDAAKWFAVTPGGQIVHELGVLGSNIVPGSLVGNDYDHLPGVYGVTHDEKLVHVKQSGASYTFGVVGDLDLVGSSLVTVSRSGAAGGVYGVTKNGAIVHATYDYGWSAQYLPQNARVLPGSLVSADGHASAVLSVNAMGRVVATYQTSLGTIWTAEIPNVFGIVPGSLAYAGPTAGMVAVDRDGKLIRIWRSGSWRAEPIAGNTAAVLPLSTTTGVAYGGDGSVYAIDQHGRLVHTRFEGDQLVASEMTDTPPQLLDAEHD
jgi:hypothetical protein